MSYACGDVPCVLRPYCTLRSAGATKHGATYQLYEVGNFVMGHVGSDHLEDHFTPWKINMEPTNSPIKRKENDLNQTSMIMFHVNLQGCRTSKYFGSPPSIRFFL